MYNHSSLVKYTASVIERSFQACHTCTIWSILQVQIFSGCCFSPQLCLHMQASCYWCLYFGPGTKGCESVKPIWSVQISPISMWNWGCRWMSPKFGDIHLQPLFHWYKVECITNPDYCYHWLPITGTLTNSNLTLTRTKIYFPCPSYIYCSFILGTCNSNPQ